MMDKGYLQNAMEQAREELNVRVLQKGIGDPSVLQQSMLLDELINQYNRIYYSQPKSSSLRSNTR
ncbi:aspartyl-phosphate phosphatase Spo0E family protein [Paenibacillus sp. sgz500958]|uniref:aspartyl-phosphate phosphatase Spo0E family protein n=1 Tax=Paenibacillus sp. sgz500958 TaxID=3242475 RepID=UPI0036D39B87